MKDLHAFAALIKAESEYLIASGWTLVNKDTWSNPIWHDPDYDEIYDKDDNVTWEHNDAMNRQRTEDWERA